MRCYSLLLPLAATSGLVHFAQAADGVNFSRDVQPILSDKCFACHGFDPETREADLRLDSFEGATANNDGMRAIVPGDVAKSEAWLRITTDDEDDIMPPKKSHKKLSAAEKDILKRWIEQGAKYQKHWAFEAPQRPALPQVQNKAWSKNAIDRFILARLEAEKLTPAAEADRRTLARRVSLDLTGLPPSPEEVELFVQDSAPDAYEQFVRRLMDSPHWGEHRARYWLDAARYGDTHGLHFDNYREMWPYRDWVINAFNRNQPFDLFTKEQLAGDLLPKPTRDQLIATGFQRCNSTTNEGGTIDDENLANYANDRVTTMSWVWLGLSANCAACHDHKFDPIKQKDFYSMAAFFRNTTQPPKDGNVKESRPILYMPKPDEEKRFSELQLALRESRGSRDRRRGIVEKGLDAWLASAKPEAIEISADKLAFRALLNEGEGDGKKKTLEAVVASSATGSGPSTETSKAEPQWQDGGVYGKALVVNADSDLDFGDVANFEKDQPFTVAAWIKTPEGLKTGSVVARFDDRDKLRKGWVVYVQDGKVGLRIGAGDAKAEIRSATKKAVLKPGAWQHITVSYDGSGAAAGIAVAVDGANQTLTPAGEPLKASIRTTVPLRVGRREVAAPLTGGSVQDVRVYARKLEGREIKALQQIPSLRAAFATEADKRTPEQKAALLEYHVANNDPELRAMGEKIAVLEGEDAQIKSRSTVTLVQEEKPNSEAMAHILMRGQYDKPGEEVRPASFSALHPFPKNAPKNRLGLADWLTSDNNALTARVTVNRFWQELFGVGLVRTSEDFGIMGDRPSHPELLDWLAVEFRESGWDVKRLFTLMVTSSAYRQAAITTPEKRERDPQNRLLSRGPRFRMDAEMIRDYALASSGVLVEKIGGPSVKPYQPEGVWEAVAMPESNTRKYVRDTGESLYRRSLYTFWKRAAPPALMDILNAPSRETCAVRRERTNTPLQALATLNDPQFVEAARKLAELALQKSNEDPEKAIAYISDRVLLRPLRDEERKIVTLTYADAERDFSARADAAKQFLSVGESKPDPALSPNKLAALSIVANQILCLDEALNK
jgi:hypothetical protein